MHSVWKIRANIRITYFDSTIHFVDLFIVILVICFLDSNIFLLIWNKAVIPRMITSAIPSRLIPQKRPKCPPNVDKTS